MPYQAITDLRQMISESDSALLDLEVMDAHQLSDIFAFFCSNVRLRTGYHDIPVRSVVSIKRKGDAYQEGDSWRDIVDLRLRGRNWQPTVFPYFENPIRDNDFPSEGARGPLRLDCYGGVTVCNNGNHRLAAGYCYLASRNQADFKEVNTDLYPVDYARIARAKALLVERGARLSVFNSKFGRVPGLNCQYLARVTRTSGECSFFTIDEETNLLWNPPTLAGKVASFFNSYSAGEAKKLYNCLVGKDWVEVPPSLFDLWGHSDWFTKAYNKAP